MITVSQYQEFTKLNSGVTENEMTINIAKLFNVNMDNLSDAQLKAKVTTILSAMTISKKAHKYVRLGKVWYKVDRDLYSWKFPQWIMFDSIMNSVDNDTISDEMHTLLAIMFRPCRLYKFFPKKWKQSRVPEIANKIKGMDIQIGLNLAGFFFLYIVNSIQNTRIDSLEELERMTWVNQPESKKSTKNTDGT